MEYKRVAPTQYTPALFSMILQISEHHTIK